MDSSRTNGDIFNGQSNGHREYSIPDETSRVFQSGILENPLMAKDLPEGIVEAAAKIQFTGSPDPSVPVNWRFSEAVASLKGLEAAIVNVLLNRKYGPDMQKVTIDTDHATLFIMSAGFWTIDPGEGGLNISLERMRESNAQLEKFFPNRDLHRSNATLHRSLTTGIHRCADGRYFNLHPSMDPDLTLDYIGLPHDIETASFEEGVKRFQDAVSQVPSDEMNRRCNEIYRQAGTICYSVDEFRNSEHGRANKDVGLWEIYDKPNSSQPPCWWPDIPSTSVHRPLAGLKVVDLTRVIAAPAITRGLAELGARYYALHFTQSSRHLKNPADREKLNTLILDADVIVQGYRPGVLDEYGLSQEATIDMCKDRKRGIKSVRENCYGWHGPWQHRSGWQQISDSSVGVSLGFGEAMGHNEPVIPIFPHADYCTGISGTCAILIALLRRGQSGGSYAIDIALNYYSAWLVNSVGEYSRAVFGKVWDEHDRKVWHSYHGNSITAPETFKKFRTGPGGKRLFKQEFFEDRSAPAILGKRKFRHVKSIAQWPPGTVEPGFRIGTRGNGVDAAHWPNDLSLEVVF